jgi:hypothetical protein
MKTTVLSNDEFTFWLEAALCFAHQGTGAAQAASEADRFLLEALKRHPEGIPRKPGLREVLPALLEMLRRHPEGVPPGVTDFVEALVTEDDGSV